MRNSLISSTIGISLLASLALAAPVGIVGGNAQDTILKSNRIGNDINTYELGAVEITAPDLVDANPSIYEITTQDFEDEHAMNLSDALRRAPGIYIQEFTGRRTEIYIRGYDSDQIGYYIDGIPMNNIFNSSTNDMDFFHTQSLSGVQISKGFTSPLYSNSLGGAINMVTAKPQKELEMRLYQKLYYGRGSGASPHQIDQGVSIGTNQGKFYFQAEASHTDRHTIPLSYSYKDTPEAGKGLKGVKYINSWVRLTAGWRPNENHEYSINYIRQYSDKNSITTSSTRESSIPDNPEDYGSAMTLNKDVVYFLGKTFFTPNLSLNSRLYYQNFYETMVWGGAPSDYDDYGFGAIFDLNWDIAERTNLKVGVNEKYDNHKGIQRYPTFDWQYADIIELKTNIFAQVSHGVGPVRLVLAGSYDRVDPLLLNYTSQWDAGSSQMQKLRLYDSIGDYTAQAAIYYDFADGNSLHLNVGKKQTWPTIRSRFTTDEDQIPNPDLKAESAVNYEVGYDLRMQSSLGSTYVSAAAYFNDMKYMLDSVTYAYATAAEAECAVPYYNTTYKEYRCYKSINMDYGYTYGGEIAVEQGFFSDKFVFGVNYSYIQKFAEGDSSDNVYGLHKIRDYANHQLNGKFAFHPLKSLDVVALWTYHSPAQYATYDTRTTNADGTYTYNGARYIKGRAYITMDLSVDYEIGKGFHISGAVYNLIDRSNWLGSGTSYYVQPGRRYVVGLEYKY